MYRRHVPSVEPLKDTGFDWLPVRLSFLTHFVLVEPDMLHEFICCIKERCSIGTQLALSHFSELGTGITYIRGTQLFA